VFVESESEDLPLGRLAPVPPFHILAIPFGFVASRPNRGKEAFGVILAVIGFLGVIFGILEYMIWSQNNATLKHNAFFGYVSQSDIDLVYHQEVMMYLGFVIGGILLMLGIGWLIDLRTHTKRV